MKSGGYEGARRVSYFGHICVCVCVTFCQLDDVDSFPVRLYRII